MRSKKFLFVAVLSILVLAIMSACSAAGTTEKPNPNTLNVSGIGRVYLIPDIAYINIGVHTEAESVAQALSQNTSRAQEISSVLTGMGVEAKDIQTSAFNIYPMQIYGPNGEMQGIKYVVDNTVYVTVRDLTKMGEILEKVAASGANNINGITFDVEDKTAALTEARKLAVEDARKQADELAAAAGVKLGKVMNLSVYSNTPVPIYDAKGGGARLDAASAVPISAGQMILEINVNILYEIQ